MSNLNPITKSAIDTGEVDTVKNLVNPSADGHAAQYAVDLLKKLYEIQAVQEIWGVDLDALGLSPTTSIPKTLAILNILDPDLTYYWQSWCYRKMEPNKKGVSLQDVKKQLDQQKQVDSKDDPGFSAENIVSAARTTAAKDYFKYQLLVGSIAPTFTGIKKTELAKHYHEISVHQLLTEMLPIEQILSAEQEPFVASYCIPKSELPPDFLNLIREFELDKIYEKNLNDSGKFFKINAYFFNQFQKHRKNLARKHHPDKFASASAQEKSQAHQKMVQINHAKDLIDELQSKGNARNDEKFGSCSLNQAFLNQVQREIEEPTQSSPGSEKTIENLLTLYERHVQEFKEILAKCNKNQEWLQKATAEFFKHAKEVQEIEQQIEKLDKTKYPRFKK